MGNLYIFQIRFTPENWGIGTVFQENSLIPHLSVAENIFLTREPRNASGLIDWKRMYGECDRWIRELGVKPHQSANAGEAALRSRSTNCGNCKSLFTESVDRYSG